MTFHTKVQIRYTVQGIRFMAEGSKLRVKGRKKNLETIIKIPVDPVNPV